LAYNITYKRSVERDLAGLAKREAKRILDRVERDLRTDPHALPMLKGQFSGLRKLRVGDYRIVFTIIDKDVLILRIGNRKDVYR
jgi:mRNA interferase RelE/StbE